jgi:hypothetical protein
VFIRRRSRSPDRLAPAAALPRRGSPDRGARRASSGGDGRPGGHATGR